jgi:hypothetical protein
LNAWRSFLALNFMRGVAIGYLAHKVTDGDLPE